MSKPVLRTDYQPYPYNLERVNLLFDLHHDITTVVANLVFKSNTANTPKLVLNGQNIQLISIELDNQTLAPDQYIIENNTLVLQPHKQEFTLTITTTCQPINNTSLMGLYSSANHLFTQCEPEGFRRITWFPDRPDVMSVYTVTLRADQTTFPVLLSNGNLVSQQSLPNNRHETVWHDPFPKPSYLFALVAGQFSVNEKQVTTQSGRKVLLQVYSEPSAHEYTHWALHCLEQSLRWDEIRFGLELDLDRFMIVAASDFNMGAMENKGLNIFNASYVLASPDTATDKTYHIIEAVIGHEYFHNWTGNRVTCRDWFQLSLKEGLTVFREQEFSAYMMAQGLEDVAAQSAMAVKRIDDVEILRSQQFPEDISPMAHSIRPESYHEISNFYTATIYEKGAEIIRMLHTLLGEHTFMQGMRIYFKRHDGQAVTCDDFLNAMESAYKQENPDQDLSIFRRWYTQAGTPTVSVKTAHNSATNTLAVTLKQSNPPVGLEASAQPQTVKAPLHIPIAFGFSGSAHTEVLELKEAVATWEFTNISKPPVISVLRGFSAPVNIEFERTSAELVQLALHDTDPFARWQAVQDLSTKYLHNQFIAEDQLTDLWINLIGNESLAPDYKARILNLIPVKQLLLQSRPLDPLNAYRIRTQLYVSLGKQLYKHWQKLYEDHCEVMTKPYNPMATHAGARALCFTALGYMVASGNTNSYELANKQYHKANNLTDRLNALQALTLYAPESVSQSLLADFYEKSKHNAQLMDHWFSLQAGANWATTASVNQLASHPQFSIRNPNRARSLIFQFCLNNYQGMHQTADYSYWADKVLTLDALNPEIAARLARGLDNWSHYAQPYKDGMQDALKQIKSHNNLSVNLSEIVNQSLGS